MAVRRPTAKEGLALVVAGAALFLYPVAAVVALARFDARSVAMVVFALAVLVVVARHLVEGRPWKSAFLHATPGLALLGASIATNDARWLRFLPALVNGYLAWWFARTLTTEQSMVERGAVFLQPYLPDFTRSYCQLVTGLWAAFFAVNAIGIAWLAQASPAYWSIYTARLYFALVMAISVVEFFVRKVYFRNYSSGPLDRAFDAVFPARNTARGRRSAAYLDRMRALGLKTD